MSINDLIFLGIICASLVMYTFIWCMIGNNDSDNE